MSDRPPVDLLIENADRVVTLAGSGPVANAGWDDLGIIEHGSVAIAGDRIAAVGRTDAVREAVTITGETCVIDARGRMVTPGFVDPHTHFLFAGNRAEEYGMRVEGVPYQTIREQGGGIRSTVRAFREATDDELTDAGRARLSMMLQAGTTTVEGKSGYGLSMADEMRALRIIRKLGEEMPLTIVPTFLGAHDIPPEFDGDRAGYIDLVIHKMIPEASRIAVFCDVFCEQGYFDRAESKRILMAGREHGMIPKLHAEEFVPMGGGELAAEVGAISADHLLVITDEGVAAMADAGVIGVLLPGTTIGLASGRWADIEKFRRGGLPVALATDCNPGSSYTISQACILSLACSLLKMTVPEAWAGVTRNAAAAIGLQESVGTLETGKIADCLVFSENHPAAVPYRFGQNLIDFVIRNGNLLPSFD